MNSEREPPVGREGRQAFSLLRLPALLVESLIVAYQRIVSPFLHALGGPGAGCRFSPSCSDYARQALRTHGLIRGSWLALRRIGRCHPWHPGGHDPVPQRQPEGNSEKR